MANKYTEMDQWSDEEVALFKESDELILEQVGNVKDQPVGFYIKKTKSPLSVISEGDSWFDYKISADLIDCLKRYHGYQIKNYATPGDTLENMIYGTETNRQYERSTPQIKVVLKRVKKEQPNVFLFSGAGNDIAGNQFGSFLYHAESGLGTLKQDFAINTIKVEFRKFYQHLIEKILQISPETHIFTHGYGYARPTGKGAGILGMQFVGPWLLPALGRKGIDPQKEGKEVVEVLIDLFNEMLGELDNEVPNFHYVDLRPFINDDDWRDEMHLKSSAFRLASDQIDLAIKGVDG